MEVSNKKQVGICRKCGSERGKYRSYCKPCEAQQSRDWTEKHPERRRDFYRKWANRSRESIAKNSRKQNLRKYGLTEASFNERLSAQNGACAICKTTTPNGPGKKFMVDHNHSTKQVRGLLCSNCNFVIGHCKEKVSVLESAIQYLRKEAQGVCQGVPSDI